MTVTLDLSPEREAALKAQAEARGLSIEQWLLALAEEHTIGHARDPHEHSAPFWQTFANRFRGLPPEVFEGLPTDGASEHDHYLYGTPKRNP